MCCVVLQSSSYVVNRSNHVCPTAWSQLQGLQTSMLVLCTSSLGVTTINMCHAVCVLIEHEMLLTVSTAW